MKRKTNLFYTSGPDSKFLTFSNYTEALTGNYLSVNSKLFPDNFLCLNIKNLNSTTKPLFIKYLVKYYENKLAVIRDHNVNEKHETIEYHIYPLAYLIEGILKIVTKDTDGEYKLNELDETNNFIKNDTLSSENIEDLITYIGQISEFDYYGTYTDIICNIEAENYNKGIIVINESNNENTTTETITIDPNNEDPDMLYGWENDYLFEEYVNTVPIYDAPNYTYNVNTNVSSIDYNKIDENSSESKIIKFNVIIPLFSLVNINRDNDYNQRNEVSQLNNKANASIKLNDGNKHCYDVPLGIWIYADQETDTFIELQKDKDLNLYPNWSLLISSQFKPFPYSTYQKVNETSNNPDSKSIMNSFSTFAEVLSKMNTVLDNFNNITINLNELNNRIDKIERNLSQMNTIENVQKLDEKITQLESSVNAQMVNFKKQLYGYLENIKWSSKG